MRPRTKAWWHGGVPDLRPGDLIEPGHERATHDGCTWCEARANGEAGPGDIDGPSKEQDRVYVTSHRLYAKHHASLWGRGDLYRVEPVGDVEASSEDTIETVVCSAARVVAVYDRAVLLTMTERRRLWREWGEADARAVHDRSGMPNGLTATGKPRKAAAAVVEAAMREEGGT